MQRLLDISLAFFALTVVVSNVVYAQENCGIHVISVIEIPGLPTTLAESNVSEDQKEVSTDDMTVILSEDGDSSLKVKRETAASTINWSYSCNKNNCAGSCKGNVKVNKDKSGKVTSATLTCTCCSSDKLNKADVIPAVCGSDIPVVSAKGLSALTLLLLIFGLWILKNASARQ